MIVIEIIVYSIKENQLESFNKLKATLIEEALTISGLKSSKTYIGDNAGQFVDIMEWESSESKIEGFEKFKVLPSTKKFMQMISGKPIFSGSFKEELV